MSSEGNAEHFIQSLKQSEREKEPSIIVDLFAEDAVLEAPVTTREFEGKDGARRFWTSYLETFNRIESKFRDPHEFGDIAVLEWESRGILPTGRPIGYSGVSIVEFDQKKIKRFATYYDTAAFLQASPAAEQWSAV